MRKEKILAVVLALMTMTGSFGVKGAEAVESGRTKAVKVVQTAGRDALGNIAPEFAHLNDDILFGEVWSRNDRLSLRDRSIITVVTLIAKGMVDSSFTYHMQNAMKNGVSREEMAEILTHEAFYAGWPNAWAAFRTMKEVYGENPDGKAETAMTREEFEKINVFGTGAPNDAYAKYFTGKSYLNPLTREGEPLPMFNVTFEPGCRNNWHIHHAKTGGGQILIVTAGRGWYQEEGKEAVELLPGAVVEIPANVKHWHGAAADSWFSHITFEIPGSDTGNEWCEPVTDDAYGRLQ